MLLLAATHLNLGHFFGNLFGGLFRGIGHIISTHAAYALWYMGGIATAELIGHIGSVINIIRK